MWRTLHKYDFVVDRNVRALGGRDKQARAPGEGVGSPQGSLQVHTAGLVSGWALRV